MRKPHVPPLIPGTETWFTYPHRETPEYRARYPTHPLYIPPHGVYHFGAIKWRGQSVYKVAKEDAARLKTIGWTLAHVAQYYAYMIPAPEAWRR